MAIFYPSLTDAHQLIGLVQSKGLSLSVPKSDIILLGGGYRTCLGVNHSPAQVQGQTVEDYMVQAQDRTKNAKAKSELAAWNMWKEQLSSDQCQFESARIMILREVSNLEHFWGVATLQKYVYSPLNIHLCWISSGRCMTSDSP